MQEKTSIISFDNGFDFMRDLLSNYEKKKALQIANDYLDMQSHINGSIDNFKNNNPEEYTFCCELYQATKQTKEGILK